MSTTHTPEPWRIHERKFVAGVDGSPVLNMGHPDHATAAANATHIVACVNACKGVNPEAVPDLLAALEACLPVLDNPAMHWELKTARAAIAKAKGIQ